jgi:hypothetical protein
LMESIFTGRKFLQRKLVETSDAEHDNRRRGAG